MSDVESSDLLRGEPPKFYQLINRHKRTATRPVLSVEDGESIIQTSSIGIATTFITYFQAKYTNIEADPDIAQAKATSIRGELPQDVKLIYENPFF
jgi:hypothetical protein